MTDKQRAVVLNQEKSGGMLTICAEATNWKVESVGIIVHFV